MCEERYAKPTFGQFGQSLSTKVHWLHGLCQSAAWHVSPKEIMLLSCKSFRSHPSCSVPCCWWTELCFVESFSCMCSWWFQAPDYNKTCWKIHPSKQVSIPIYPKKTGSPLSTYLHPITFSCYPKPQKKTQEHLGSLFFSDFQERHIPNLCMRETCAAQTFLHETLTSR